MDKTVLEQYIDACALIRETEEDIRKLKKRKGIVQDSVKGSNPEFPYQAQSFHIEVTAEQIGDQSVLEAEEKILEMRKADARKIKMKVEAWMNTIPQRMQRIIRFKFFQNLSWEETAHLIGKGKSGESTRKELENFLKK